MSAKRRKEPDDKQFEYACVQAADRILWFCHLYLQPRSGEQMLYFGQKPEGAKEIERPSSVLEHTALILAQTDIIIKMFAPMYPFLRKIGPHEILLYHDIAEKILSDIPDDGTMSKEEKDKIEAGIVHDFLSVFPKKDRNRIYQKFREFQKANSFEYVMDKFNFIIMQAFLVANGKDGDMRHKEELGLLKEQDKNFMKTVGSYRALDNTYVHFLTITKGIRGRTICIGIMEQVYNQLFGEVPESVKRYY